MAAMESKVLIFAFFLASAFAELVPKQTEAPVAPTPANPVLEKLKNLTCMEYDVSLNTPLPAAPAGPAGQQTVQAAPQKECEICRKIREAYKGYKCFMDVQLVNVQIFKDKTAVTNLLIQFSCPDKHLKRLANVIGSQVKDAKCHCPAGVVICQPVVPVCPVPCQPSPVPGLGCPSECAPEFEETCCRQHDKSRQHDRTSNKNGGKKETKHT